MVAPIGNSGWLSTTRAPPCDQLITGWSAPRKVRMILSGPWRLWSRLSTLGHGLGAATEGEGWRPVCMSCLVADRLASYQPRIRGRPVDLKLRGQMLTNHCRGSGPGPAHAPAGAGRPALGATAAPECPP